jgi:tetratricopeptide (TPR) repeat protein
LLAHALRKFYLLSRPLEDLSALEESITLLQQAIDSTSIDDGRRSEWLISLAFGLSLRCDATESKIDAIEASRVALEAMETLQKDDPSYATILQSACHFISKKTIRLHDEDDFGKVFEMHKSILEVTPFDHPKYTSRLHSYGDTLFKEYLAFGEQKALEESIRVSQHIVTLPDNNSEEHARHVWILGQRLVQRYLRTGTSADLDESIKTCQQAIQETPVSSKNRQRRLQSLCDRLGEKYSQTLDEADFQAAKVVMDQLLNQLPTKPKGRARSLGNIGIILSLRYRQTGRQDDFQRAIGVSTEAINLTADGDMGRTIRLSNLGGLFLEAYGKTGNMERLEESIYIGRQALAATPEGHPDRALRNFNLADRLRLRYLEYSSTDDLQEAISFYQLTLDQSSVPMFLRVQAGRSLMQSCVSNHDWERAYEVGSKAITILSVLRPRSLKNADLQREASKLSGLATQAAAIALDVGKSAVVALEFLEMARGVIASSINVLRADINDLERELPKLADRYNRLREELEEAAARRSGFELGEEVWGNAMSQRYDIGEQMSSLLEEIRLKPGLKNFLRADDEERMQSAAALSFIRTY